MKRGVVIVVLLLVAAAFPAAVLAESAADLYTLNCWGCHSPHAEGIPGSVPRLSHSMGYFLRIPEGREYLVRVPGVANSPLNDEQIAQVLNWMLGKFSKDELPPDFKPYSAAEVKLFRPNPILNVRQVRSELAKKLSALGNKVSDF